jgi:uncharacterized protein (TIGR02246 family)
VGTLVLLWANGLFAQPPVLKFIVKTGRYSVARPSECRELSSADLAALRKVNTAYPAAWLANDSAAVMRLFSPDATLIPHHGDAPVEGEAAIRRHFWPPNPPYLRVDAFQMQPAEIAGCGDLAYARGRFEIEYTTDADGARKKYANAGNYLMIFRKRGDQWLISRYIWDDGPSQTLPATLQR